MKKLAVLAFAFAPALSAFAYYDDPYDRGGSASGWTIFFGVLYLALAIVFIVRWWQMTCDVKKIREHLTQTSDAPKLTYLVAIGEMEQANKAALTMLVNKLLPIYSSSPIVAKAKAMNAVIHSLLPKMMKLGLTMPDYVTSGEKFIDYMNGLTGGNVTYAN